jgi:sec-independent protein translocase protein TatB
MFDVASPELLLVAVVAVVVIGPKDLPKAMRVVGYWVGKARGTMRQFRAGFDAMVREAELAEMEKKWAEENKRIMAEHPPSEAEPPALPAPDTRDAEGDPAPVMTEKPAIHDEPELPLAPAPETRAP